MDRFKVISLIGEGSFGRVYKAKRLENNEVVAIKIITKRGRTNRELKNLRRECDIQAKLNHPNIIGMLEAFEGKNEVFVVTEFAQTDLHRFLAKRGSLNEEKAQKMAGELVSALYYLHSHRILHRDLKPQNVLLVDDLHVKLCDFGLARNMTMGTHVLTSIKGTPLYMAPELLIGKPYDHLVDLWSLGCIVYETLSGQPPFCTTSYLHLLRLIQHEEVKWPSFLTSDCISFLQGLLEKDSCLRLTWAQILCHPFVEGRLTILKEEHIDPTFINPSEMSSNDKASTSKGDQSLEDMSSLNLTDRSGAGDNISSSKDSMNAIIHTDVENLETDVEDLENRVEIPFASDTPFEPDLGKKTKASTDTQEAPCFVSGNPNLIVNHFNDNFSALANTSETKQKAKLTLNLKKTAAPSQSGEKGHRNKDLEKRKLSQNLDNFSLRLGQSVDTENVKKVATVEKEVGEKKKVTKNVTIDDKSTENTPPNMLPGWDSCDESQSPPIENEEWIAFLHRSVQEVLDGELDSLRQQNLVSIIVAPLRNSRASSKVIQSVAQLLSLPLVLGGPSSILECIKNVYVEVKLVPNLVYASKLIASTKSTVDSSSSPTPISFSRTFRSITDLGIEEIKTISSLYELVCHLVHLNERFLTQFCDAVAVLSADELLINFLSHDFRNAHEIRTANCVIALLCCVVRELPENAELVEKIVFNQRLNLIGLMKNKNSLLRSRICMLFRLLGRFSCRGLQNVWNTPMRETIEALMYDSSEQVRMEAEFALDELKQFSFYNQDTS